MKKLLLLAGFLLCAGTAWSGPFGLSKGMSVEQVRALGPLEPSKTTPYAYAAKSLRDGHDAFEAYSFLITPEDGLCKVTAIGKDVKTSVYGDELKRAFTGLADALAEKYGRPSNQYDFLRSGSMWNEPKDFMMGLVRKERTLSWYWMGGLPDELQSIAIEARGISASAGFISLSYEFQGSDACVDKATSRRNRNL